MSLEASNLRLNDIKKREIIRQSREILFSIDRDIITKHDQGKYNTIYILPAVFAVPNMKNKDAQKHIYVEIIKSLVERGFNPLLNLKTKSPTLNITWVSDAERKNNEYASALLAKHTLK